MNLDQEKKEQQSEPALLRGGNDGKEYRASKIKEEADNAKVQSDMSALRLILPR